MAVEIPPDAAPQHTGRPPRAFQVQAVVLRHQDWGEADRLVTLFSLEMGKLRALAKGVRKPRSRKAGHLEPFTHVRLLLARGRDLPIITQADTIQAHLETRDDLVRVTYAAYVVELLDRFTYEEGQQRGLFQLLVDTLQRLDTQSKLDLVIRYYEIRLLDQVGFRPQLFHCVQCESEIIAEDQYFSAQQGGALCPRCGQTNIQASPRPVSMTALKYFRHLQRSAFSQVLPLNIPPGVLREMEILMQYYLTYLLERNLNTPPFLRQVRKESNDPFLME
jgi:DNA repair protein RecO (recombination protein O)